MSNNASINVITSNKGKGKGKRVSTIDTPSKLNHSLTVDSNTFSLDSTDKKDGHKYYEEGLKYLKLCQYRKSIQFF